MRELYAYEVIDDVHQAFSGGAPLVQVKAPPKLEKDQIVGPEHSPVYCAFPAGRLLLYVDNDWDEEVNLHEGFPMTKRELVDALDGLANKGEKNRRSGEVVRVSTDQITTTVPLSVIEEKDAEIDRLRAQVAEGNKEQTVRVTPDQFETEFHQGKAQCEVCDQWVQNKGYERHCYFASINGKNLPQKHDALRARQWPASYAKSKK